MSTSVLKALSGKLDIKRHSPSILYLSLMCKCHLNDNAGVSSKVRFFFSLSLNLHPCFVYASSESTGKPTRMYRLAWAIAAY